MDLSKIVDTAMSKTIYSIRPDGMSLASEGFCDFLSNDPQRIQKLLNYSYVLLEEYHKSLKAELSKQGITI